MTEDEGREQLMQIRQQTNQCAAANDKAEKTLNRLMQHIFIEAEHRMMSRVNQSKILSGHSNFSSGKPSNMWNHACAIYCSLGMINTNRYYCVPNEFTGRPKPKTITLGAFAKALGKR